MKNTFIIIALILFSNYAQSQRTAMTSDGIEIIVNDNGTWTNKSDSMPEKKELVSVSVDKMTGKKTVKSKPLLISDDGNKTGLNIFCIKSRGYVIFNIKAISKGNCIDEGDKVNILFRDGSRLELRHNGRFNCRGNSTCYLNDSSDELKQLNTKEVETIRVWKRSNYLQKDLNKNQSETLTKTFNALKKY